MTTLPLKQDKIKYKNLKRVQLSHSQRMKHYWNNISDACRASIAEDSKIAYEKRTPEQRKAFSELMKECSLDHCAKRTVRDTKIRNLRHRKTVNERRERREKGELTYGEHELYLYCTYKARREYDHNLNYQLKHGKKQPKRVHIFRKRIHPDHPNHPDHPDNSSKTIEPNEPNKPNKTLSGVVIK